MNIEQAIKILKQEPVFSLNYYNRENAIDIVITAYEKEKEKNKKAIYFINDEKNYFEDGENWQNILKIKEILEE